MSEKIFRLGVEDCDPHSDAYHHIEFSPGREAYLKALLADQSDGDRVVFSCRWSLHIALAKGWVEPRQGAIVHGGIETPATLFYVTAAGIQWASS